MSFIIALILSFAVTWVVTWLVKKMAVHFNIIDYPNEPRKIHKKPTPLLGGVAIFVGFFIVLGILTFATPYILDTSLKLKHLIGLFVGGLILMIGGALDDKWNLKPSRQIIFPILAAIAVIASGIGVRQITNPFGGVINLVELEKVLFWWRGVGYRITLPADLFTFIWLLGMIYTTKFLDGLDGLVSGITAIGALMIFFLTTMTKWFQPEVGMISIIATGAFLGFLIWNWHPAKIFLGTSGSTFAGFLLGTLAIISGGKIATALLVLGIPILDVVWVILRRIFYEKKSPTQADSKHLHFRLLDLGFSHRGAVLFLYSISLIFGLATLFLQSREKLIALSVLFGMMVILAFILIKRSARQV
jgi:UDP-GlcNAc:undecaprenyl-phosphate GlcNAc-1-phosphate transferase